MKGVLINAGQAASLQKHPRQTAPNLKRYGVNTVVERVKIKAYTIGKA